VGLKAECFFLMIDNDIEGISRRRIRRGIKRGRRDKENS
jgi:hypothetical protein